MIEYEDGVAIFLHFPLKCSVVFSGSKSNGYETLAADIAHLDTAFRITLVLRPPSASMHYTEPLAKAISNLSMTDTPVISVGDLNRPEVKWVEGTTDEDATNTLSEMFSCHGYVQLIKEPTRGHNILDLLFCNSGINRVSVLSSVGESDHNHFQFSKGFSLR